MRLALSSLLFITCAALPDVPGDCENTHCINLGFDLKFGYGTASISYPNGTALQIAKVESTDEYRATFRKLSLWSNTHDAPPYYTPQERWSDYGRQLKRRARKAVGLAASADVEAISTLIRDLKEATEKAMGFEMIAAAASIPRVPAIYDEDLYDAFEYVGLEYLQLISSTYHKSLLTYESMAALAGHGFDLCPNATHPRECSIEDLEGQYYVVDYSKYGLFAYHTTSRSAYFEYETVYFNLDLGSEARHNNPDEKYYWDEVRKILLSPLMVHTSEHPTKIIIVGEEDSVNDPQFRKVLNLSLDEYYKEGVPEIVDNDPEWVQAKGVAEFVRRRPYRTPKPVKPEGGKMWSDFFIGQNVKEEKQPDLSMDQMDL